MKSQLEIIMKRILLEDVKITKNLKDGDPNKKLDHLITLAQYLRYYPEAEKDILEKEMAIHMLEMYKMANLLVIKDHAKFEEMVKSYQKRRAGFCVRCGRPIQVRSGKINGMGKTCYEMAEKGIWRDNDKMSKAGYRLEEIIANLDKSRLEKEGVRRLSEQFGVGISTIRYDMKRAIVVKAADEKYLNLKDKAEKILEKYQPTRLPLLLTKEEKCQN